MAHAIEGNKAFFVSTPAWHGLGTVLNDAPSVEQAWQLAYPHGVIECAVEAVLIDAEGNKHSLPLERNKAIIRDDGVHLGTVGARYQVEQPSELLNFFTPFLTSGYCTLEAGGSLDDGKRMWALAKINNSELEVARGDTVEAYLLAVTAFDGSLAKVIKFCATRVVCANTVAVALGEKVALEFKIRHTTNMGSRTLDAQAQIGQALEAHRTSVEAYRSLAAKTTPRPAQVTYVHNVMAPNIKQDDYTPQLKTKVNLVIDLLDQQRGLELVPAIRGTAWQAYNAVSEYITHHAARTADKRLNNQWLDGPTQALNRQALDLALAM